MFKHAACAVIAGLLLANPALGAPPRESGFFVGGSFGAAEFDDDGLFYWLQFDDSDTSVTIFAGYKFFRYLALEARVGDLGRYTISDGVESEKLRVKLASAHAVGIAPLGQSGWELYGQLGLGRLDFSCSGCGDETVGSAGLGVRFSPARQLAIGAQLDAYAWDEGPFELAVTTAQLVLQYLF